MRCLLCVKLLHEISILTKILSFSEAFGVRPKIPGLNIIHLKDNWRALILVLVQWPMATSQRSQVRRWTFIYLQ